MNRSALVLCPYPIVAAAAGKPHINNRSVRQSGGMMCAGPHAAPRTWLLTASSEIEVQLLTGHSQEGAWRGIF